jgi:RNA polymerase sigma-70 factor (ECF subfamily)
MRAPDDDDLPAAADDVAAQRWNLLLQHRKMLTDYIRCVAAGGTEADDIFQEVGLLVLKHRTGPTDLATAGAWLRGVARNVVLQHVRSHSRRRRRESEEILDLIDRTWAEEDAHAELWNQRRQALAGCLEKLNAADQQLLRERYAEGLASDAIASRVKRSPEAVRMKIMRLRQALSRCIGRQMAAGES